MKLLLPLLLLTFAAGAQSLNRAKVATSTATTAPWVYTQSSVDALVNQLTRRIASLESQIIRLRPGTVDTLTNINTYLTSISRQVAGLGASLSTLNATLAGNIATDNAQAVQISNAQAASKQALEAASALLGTIDNLKNYLRATP